MEQSAWDEAIAEATGADFRTEECVGAGGGCINRAVRLTGEDGRRFFVKLNSSPPDGLFAAEMRGLNSLRAAEAIALPRPICHGKAGREAFLVLEWVEMGAQPPTGMRAMGQQLAALHRTTAPSFGLDFDNHIGATPQINQPRSADWVSFYRDQRLRYQLDLAARSGLRIPEAERLLEALPEFFLDYQPAPALLHGDLWGGNAAFTAQGEPLLFDPACYYGDREAEIAFTEMFGGFDRDFYAAYNEAWPLDSGYARRRPLYNLYHELNHYNLFGGHYGQSAAQTVWHLLGSL